MKRIRNMKGLWSFVLVISLFVIPATSIAKTRDKSNSNKADFRPPSEEESSEPPTEERQKYQNLLTMRDQSNHTYYEQKSTLTFVFGTGSLFVNPGTGLGIQGTSLLGGVEYAYRIHPQFELGGYAHLTGFGASSTFTRDTLVIPVGFIGNFYPTESVYFGLRMGPLVETLGGFPELRFSFGPQIGCDFRVAELLSVGAEFGIPLVGGRTPYSLMMFTGHMKIWF